MSENKEWVITIIASGHCNGAKFTSPFPIKKKKVSSVWGLFHVENSQDPKNSRINFDLPL